MIQEVWVKMIWGCRHRQCLLAHECSSKRGPWQLPNCEFKDVSCLNQSETKAEEQVGGTKELKQRDDVSLHKKRYVSVRTVFCCFCYRILQMMAQRCSVKARWVCFICWSGTSGWLSSRRQKFLQHKPLMILQQRKETELIPKNRRQQKLKLSIKTLY